MASFNAELAVKAMEKRLDRMDTMLAALDKQVRALIDTRGMSKEKALDELMKVVPAMKEADSKLKDEVAALKREMKDSLKEWASLPEGEMERSRKEFQELDKVQTSRMKLLEADIEAIGNDVERMKKLNDQRVESTMKKTLESQQAIIAEQERLAREVNERVRTEALYGSQIKVLTAQIAALTKAVESRGK